MNYVDLSGLIKMVNGKAQNIYKYGSGNKNGYSYEAKDILKMQKKLQELGYKAFINSPDSFMYRHCSIINIGNGNIDNNNRELDRRFWDIVSLLRG